MRVVSGIALALVAAAAAVARADDTPPSGDFALSGCRIITAAGGDIEDGVVLVKGGKIEAVGPKSEVKVPRGTALVRAEGKVVSPAFVHVASRIGLRGNGGGNSNTIDPEKTVADELNPWLDANRWSAANGFATLGLLPGQGIVGGRGVVVRSAAVDVESMTRRADSFLRVDVEQGTRFVSTISGQLSIGRKDLDSHAKWKHEHAEWEKKKKEAEAAKKKPPTEPKEPKLSESRDAYHKVLRGEMALLCVVTSAADVVSLTEALADEGVRGDQLRLVCMLSGDAFRAAPELLDLGATCVVRATNTAWPNTDQTVSPPVHLSNAGLDVVLMPRDDGRAGLGNYTMDLARMVEVGMARDAVWRAACADAAEVLGVADKTGTIQKDRQADLILWSGDPLLATSRLERVWIDGVPVEDVR